MKFTSKGFVFTFEAVVSVMILITLLIVTMPVDQEDLSQVIVYKQASDLLQVMLKNEVIEEMDSLRAGELVHALGLRARILVEGELLLNDQDFEVKAVVTRLIVKNNELREVRIETGPPTP